MFTGKKDGFTLIEVLIVILILSILGGIGIPALLGQREKAKARALEVSAKGLEKELSILVGDFGRGYPLIFSDSTRTLGCYELEGAGKFVRCSTIYPDMPRHGTYQSITDFITLFVSHHNEGLLDISPYDKAPLLTTDSSSRTGHVLITNTSERALLVSSWVAPSSFLTNSSIVSR